MSEFEIPHIPEMARTLEVNYLGCTCFLPSKIVLLCTEERAARSPSWSNKSWFCCHIQLISLEIMSLQCSYTVCNIHLYISLKKNPVFLSKYCFKWLKKWVDYPQNQFLIVWNRHFDGLKEIFHLFSSAEVVDRCSTSLMRRPCFTPQEATMGIWSDYFVAHSAAAFEVLLHSSPLRVPPVRVRRVGAALSLRVTDHFILFKF